MPTVKVRHFNGDREVCQCNDRVKYDVQLDQMRRMALILILRSSYYVCEGSKLEGRYRGVR